MTKQNIPEQLSQAAKDSVSGGKKLWSNYLQLLLTHFQNMTRYEQEELITKLSWIITVGGAALAWCQIYPLFHPMIRLFACPITGILAYWFGKNIVSRIMIDRFSSYLNNE
jgi:hypothetical protein